MLKRKICFLFAVSLNFFLVSQTRHYSWDFSGCEIKDILYAVSLDTGISIVPDDTVEGTGDLKFAGSDFTVAFDSFLKASRLYVEKKENVWTVSRCSLCRDGLGRLSLDACDLSPAVILEKVSLFVDSVITYDSLPNGKMSVHFRDLSESEFFESLARRFGAYEVIGNSTGLHFSKKVDVRSIESASGYVKVDVGENDSVSVDLRDALFSEVIDSLFTKCVDDGAFGFCLLDGADVRIQRCTFEGKNFEDTLLKVCAQNGFVCSFKDGVFYIMNGGRPKDEIANGERQWQKFFLKYTSAEVIFPVIYSQFGKIECSKVPDQNYFFARVNQDEYEKISRLIEEVDVKISTFLVELKYLRPGEFLQQIPPSVKKENVFISDDNGCVYFKGSDEEYKNLCDELFLIDKPVKRISYDLLILQYDESKQNMWNGSFGVDTLKMGDRNVVSAGLGSVMSLNLNVISAFGLEFASALQASLEDSSTKVFADTTIHGISGKKICFQNTNTYRYRDNNLDPDTGKPVYSGVTKEIISGITLDILGWVSGDDMVTSTVTATVSRQGSDLSSSTGNPPPTSEKVVTTEVCCKSGEPVVLSGLIQNSQTVKRKRMPFLHWIPILGPLFSAKEKTAEDSQMVIYLVPHVEGYENELGTEVYTQEWAENRVINLIKGVSVKNEEL